MDSSHQNEADNHGPKAAILDATIEIMRQEGYAAVSSRKIAERAGLKSKLVHYYFKNMDELFLAVFQRAEQRHFDAQAKALASDQPLRELWKMSTDSSNTSITAELIALANHRKSLKQEIARSSERSRKLQAAILERALKTAQIDDAAVSPMLLSLVMTAISRLIAMDNVLGVTAGHSEAAAYIESFLKRLEAAPAPATFDLADD